jgi:protein gp37/ParB-like chromosome segregation protein Spo0J
MEFHPIAEVWPLFDAGRLAALAENIALFGLQHPIVTYEGKILDGRNRYLACKAGCVEPHYVAYEGNDPIGYAISLNEQRRHMDIGQRALVAAKLSNLSNGRPAMEKTAGQPAVSQAQAAERLSVSRDSVTNAAKVLRDGCEALVKSVETGRIPVTVAAKLANLTPIEQLEVCELDDKDDIAERAEEADKIGRQRRSAGGGRAAKGAKPPQFITLSQWKEMTPAERYAAMDPTRYDPQIFNKQKNDLIDWAHRSWNPITGCEHDCPYCYARDIANQIYPHKFEPTIYPGRLTAPDRTTRPDPDDPDIRTRNVFTGSMSDIFGRWVPHEWTVAVLEAAGDAPWWNFLYLTKFPQAMTESVPPGNCWMGTTVDCQVRVANAEKAFAKLRDAGYSGVAWLSVEPMLTPLHFNRLELFDWVVIGGASESTKTPEWHPPLGWVADLVEQCNKAGCRVYFKENLLQWRKEMPWDDAAPTPAKAPQVFQYLGPKLDVVK